jgi:3'(2'), 5'-bisphosphate nucleotidase
VKQELAVASALAREAGALIEEVKRGGVDVEMKAGDEPVTIADRRASELIVRGLREAFPDDVVISEESDEDRERRLGAARVWYIDPIDGTRDFIAGRPGYAVMIGLCVAHQPVLGVVFQPSGGDLFTAAGGAATLHPGAGGAAQPMRVSDVRDTGQIRLVASASHRTAAIDKVKTALGIANELNIGSVGLKLALIAAGERDLYVNPSAKSKLWDVCAPEAILRAAGGRLTDAKGRPVRYDAADLACKAGLVASNGHVHDEVVAKLAPLFFSRPS